MTDVPNHVSKQHPPLMAIIIVISLEHFTLRTFWTVTPQNIRMFASCMPLPHYLKMT